MAVVKANYTKVNPHIKATVRYIQHRRGKDGQKIERTLFNHDGGVERKQAYEIIDSFKNITGIKFYRIILSPDPKQEDTQKDLPLREVTKQTMLTLEKQLQQKIPFLAAIHDDHRPHRHVHIIAPIQGKLNKEDLQLLRLSATEISLGQRRELDLSAQFRQERGLLYSRTIQRKKEREQNKTQENKTHERKQGLELELELKH